MLDLQFAVFQVEMYAYICICVYIYIHCSYAVMSDSSDAAEMFVDMSAVVCCFLLCVFVCEAQECERLREHIDCLSDCVTAKLKFVSVLNIHSQCVLHCTLFKSCTQQASPPSSKSS